MSRKGLKRADIWLPVGPHCRAVYWLRELKLTRFAAPSDWTILPNIDTLLELYRSRFSGFLDEVEEFQPAGEGTHRHMRDTRYRVDCIHHFDAALPVEEERIRVRKQALRRAWRTHFALLGVRTIGLVGSWKATREELCDLLKGFARMYPRKNITLYNVCHDPEEKDCREIETVISSRLTLVEYIFDDTSKSGNPEGWRGNRERWKQILGQFSLSKWGRLCRKLTLRRH